MPNVVTFACLAFMLSMTGCLADGPGSGPRPGDPVELTADCDQPSNAMLLLERHTDHSFGHSEYWHITENGEWTILAGTPRLQEARLRAAAPWAGPALEDLCPIIAAFDRPNPFHGVTMYQNLSLTSAEVARVLDLEELRGHADAAFDLQANSSAGCDSGGDTWTLVTVGTRRHEVEASCAPDHRFEAWLTQLYDLLGRQPFEHRP